MRNILTILLAFAVISLSAQSTYPLEDCETPEYFYGDYTDNQGINLTISDSTIQIYSTEYGLQTVTLGLVVSNICTDLDLYYTYVDVNDYIWEFRYSKDDTNVIAMFDHYNNLTVLKKIK